MVLQELGQKLQSSLRKLSSHSNVDSKLIQELLKDITKSLLESDIHISLVSKLRDGCLKELSELQGNGSSVVKRDFQRVIFNALTRLVDPGVQAPIVKKGRAVQSLSSSNNLTLNSIHVHYEKASNML